MSFTYYDRCKLFENFVNLAQGPVHSFVSCQAHELLARNILQISDSCVNVFHIISTTMD